MSLLDAFRIALRAIIANRLRSALTLLGLIIGVSSVIALIAVGQGTQKGITEQIQGLGLNLIFISPSIDAEGGGGGGAGFLNVLTYGDAQAILANGDPEISDVAAHLTGNGQAIAGANDVPAEVVFTWSNYAGVVDAEVANGVFIAPAHDEEGELVAVLGSNMAEALFGEADPIGQGMRISFFGGQVTIPFTVIGVLRHAGQEGANVINNQVFIGATGLANRFRDFFYTPEGDVRVTGIVIQTVDNADLERIKEQVSELLLLRHRDAEPQFDIESQDELLEAAGDVAQTLSILLGSIAGISLVVGGIGVMNIMLVSVTERTREIGIRRAVGATGGDIVTQFVTEALTLSLIGGLAGIIIGVGASLLVDGQSVGDQELTTVIQAWSIAVAFGVAAGIGFLSGIYPAWRATVVDPIAALRNE